MIEIFYYDLKDLKKIGKSETDHHAKTRSSYIYEDKEWVYDADGLITERLLGIDDTEETGSPYRFGNSEMLNSIEEIKEEDLAKLILKYY